MFDNIEPDDIILQTKDVCILHPDIKKGILVFHSYPSSKSLEIKEGLKSNKYLMSQGISTHSAIPHSCIFFRAPFKKPHHIDYDSVKNEIASVYQVTEIKLEKEFYEHKMWIRVDPRKTNTFSSEIRDIFTYPQHYRKPGYLQNSKKTMLRYFDIIDSNRKIIQSNPELKTIFNLFSSRVVMRSKLPIHLKSPMNKYDVSRNTEVLVEVPHLKPEYFVKV